jgi:hypothetical protein
LEKARAISKIEEALQIVEKVIKEKQGSYKLLSKPQVIGSKDDRDLDEIKEKYGQVGADNDEDSQSEDNEEGIDVDLEEDEEEKGSEKEKKKKKKKGIDEVEGIAGTVGEDDDDEDDL